MMGEVFEIRVIVMHVEKHLNNYLLRTSTACDDCSLRSTIMREEEQSTQYCHPFDFVRCMAYYRYLKLVDIKNRSSC